jgi:hypothetical protein
MWLSRPIKECSILRHSLTNCEQFGIILWLSDGKMGEFIAVVAVILVMWIAKNSLERVIEDNTPANDVVIVASESLESVDPSSELLQPLILKIDGSVLSTNGQAALLDQKPDS